ncbi:hypothetical protein N7481_004875 [Penicillium waksmanii]|uniref:uncharacterized protein n=1 Tax=Penicillium waksmanii TaxID=69791 RepID=UPI002549A5DE|nr:uncharacterized protein N7481_004875 [Penicillium waksmanii]KAJ5989665.1 hypothetical protein N7481_004875 [Penicillium waksmanii]
MRLSLILVLSSLAVALELAESSCSTTVLVTETTTSTEVATATALPFAVTVATDDAGKFTDIGKAISYAQKHAIPTVTVLAGTYPAITVSATPSVAVIGQPKSQNDYSQNKVTIADDNSALIITASIDGIEFKNIDFVNTGSGKAAIIAGAKNVLYNCQFISPAIILLKYGGRVADTKGSTSSGTLLNSTTVLDRCIVSEQSGGSDDHIYLVAAKGPGSVVVFRSSGLESSIAGSGVHIDDTTQDDRNLHAEYSNTGPGAYANNIDKRSEFVSLLSSADLAPFTISAVLADADPKVAISDSAVLSAMESADVVAPPTTSSTNPGGGTSSDGSGDGDSGDGGSAGGKGSGSSNNSSGDGNGNGDDSSSSGSSDSEDGSSGSEDGSGDGNGSSGGDGGDDSSSGSGDGNGSSSGDGSSSASNTDTGSSGDGSGSGSGSDSDDGSGGSATGNAQPSTTLVVSTSHSSGQFNNVTAALSALPDNGDCTILIQAGDYEEQISITRSGQTTLRGETHFPPTTTRRTKSP